MKYLNIPINEFFECREYVLSNPVQRATFFNLLFLCCRQECGNRITGCADWGNDTWQQMCKIRLKEVKDSCQLFWWEGSDLVLFWFPSYSEGKTETTLKFRDGRSRTSSENGKKGGRPKRVEPLFANLIENLTEKPNNLNAGGNIKEKKEKENEYKERSTSRVLIPSGELKTETVPPSPHFPNEQIVFSEEVKNALDAAVAEWNTLPNVKPFTALVVPESIRTDFAKRFYEYGEDGLKAALNGIRNAKFFKNPVGFGQFVSEKIFSGCVEDRYADTPQTQRNDRKTSRREPATNFDDWYTNTERAARGLPLVNPVPDDYWEDCSPYAEKAKQEATLNPA